MTTIAGNPDVCDGDGGASGRGPKAARLPRWTRKEILVLIEAKRLADTRGWRKPRAQNHPPSPSTPASPAEPKWAAVSSYCRGRGVIRGPLQCRKRWANLSGDFRKIKEWETGRDGGGGEESFWVMRGEAKKERRLPGSFDRTVYDVLDGKAEVKAEAVGEEVAAPVVEEEYEDEEELIFDSGRAAGDNGLFSDCEQDEEEWQGEQREDVPMPPVAVMPISERRSEPFLSSFSSPGTACDQLPADDPERTTPPADGHKRRRMSADKGGDLKDPLMEIIERNSRLLVAHLEAHNTSWQMDREQSKDQTKSVIEVLHKLADALGKIADKL